MSGESSERQFEASATRLRKARQEGDLPRSSDLTGALGFAAGLVALALMMPVFGAAAVQGLTSVLVRAPADVAIPSLTAYALLPAAASACAAIVGGALQGGGLQLSPVGLKFERLSPAQGLRRIFSRQTAITALRGSVAAACAIGVLGPLVYGVLSRGVQAHESAALALIAWAAALRVGFAGAGIAIVFGGIDFAVIFANWRKRLRMTLEEFRRDQKENDGDPLLRSRRRARQREYSRDAVQRVAEAAFVVVNPQHIAVALAYRPPEVAVPRVLIRAAQEAALRVRKAAAEYNIPLVENVWLARALYASVVPGDFIPKELYVAVATIVAALARNGALPS